MGYVSIFRTTNCIRGQVLRAIPLQDKHFLWRANSFHKNSINPVHGHAHDLITSHQVSQEIRGHVEVLLPPHHHTED